MKKVISIIIGLLCVCATYAISYASPYKGGVSRHPAHTAYSSSMASMPTASMGSVSAGMMSSGNSSNNQSSRDINYATIGGLSGIATCASSIRGGVTTRQTAAAMTASQHAGPRRIGGHNGDAEECPYCHDDDDDGYCDACGCEMDKCTCATDPYGPGYCWCPIEWDWTVLAFLSLLSFAYMAYKKRQKMSNFVKTVF